MLLVQLTAQSVALVDIVATADALQANWSSRLSLVQPSMPILELQQALLLLLLMDGVSVTAEATGDYVTYGF